MIQLPDSTIKAKSEGETALASIQDAMSFIDAFQVEDNDSLEGAVQMLATIKTQHKEIDDKEKSFTNPLKKVVKDLTSFFKPAKDALQAAEISIKGKVSTCVANRLETRDKLLQQVETATAGKRDIILAKADQLVPPKIDGLSIREVFTGTLESNSRAVQWCIANNRPELLEVNTQALEALTKAQGGEIDIDGWKVFKKSTVVITPSKVK